MCGPDPREGPGRTAASDAARLWGIVLAAGGGKRLLPWTTTLEGQRVPKQFWPLRGGETMLRWALARARGVVPDERLLVVVAEEHRRWWQAELAGLPPENVVVQPRDRGTAAGVLLPFLRIFPERDPRPQLLVLPSDHHVAHEDRLRAAVLEARRHLAEQPEGLALFGIQPRQADAEYGWILPAGVPAGPLAPVEGFVEKPGPERAAALMQRGALINSFILLSEASALLRAYEQALPGLLRSFMAFARGDAPPQRVEELYRLIPAADFSREVLERVRPLLVCPVPDCGWSDLGTVVRLQAFLAGGRQGAPGASSSEPARPASSLP